MEKDLAQQQLDALPLYLFCSLDMVIKIEEIKVQTTVYQTYWLGCKTGRYKWLFEGSAYSMKNAIPRYLLNAVPLYLFYSLDMVKKRMKTLVFK